MYVIPGIIGGLWLYKLPESPKYMLSQGKDEAALKTVQWMIRINKGNTDDLRIEKLKPEVIENTGKQYKGL